MTQLILKTFCALTFILLLVLSQSVTLGQTREIVLTDDLAYYKDNPPGVPPSPYTPVDVKPETLKCFNPLYPPAAYNQKIEGIVYVSCWVTAQGTVRQCKITWSANKILNRAALESCLHWIFKPAIKDGQGIDVIATVPIKFKIEDTSPDGFALQNLPEKKAKIKNLPVVKHDTLTYPVSLVLPPAVTTSLNEKLRDWRIAKLSEDSLNPKYDSFFKCDLNKDKKPDYVFVVVTGNKSTLTEHYVAIVSDGDKYNAFILRSYNISKFWIDYYYLSIQSKNTYVAVFGDLDPALTYKIVKDQPSVTFDVDCITIATIIGNQCDTYVYHNGKFYDFSSCD